MRCKISYADLFSMMNLLSGFAGIVTLNVYFIILSALFDGIDGFIARYAGGSELGVELDSLADLVSFGLLPSFFLAKMWKEGFLISAIYVICSAFRLARFNVLKSENFVGLPITASALIIFCLIKLKMPVFLIGIATLILSAVMVSKIEYVKVRDEKLLLLCGIALILSFNNFGAILLLFLCLIYALSPLWGWKNCRN